jgi:hypothetical protein
MIEVVAIWNPESFSAFGLGYAGAVTPHVTLLRCDTAEVSLFLTRKEKLDQHHANSQMPSILHMQNNIKSCASRY